MTFVEALESCLRFVRGADELHEEMKGVDGIHHDYLEWGEVTVNQNVQLDRLVRIGVNRAEAARRDGRRAFVSEDDGTGVHVFFARDEHELVAALARLSSQLQAKI